MPPHAPAGDSRKDSPKPIRIKDRAIKERARNRKAAADSPDEDAAVLEWRKLADLQFLDG